MNILAGVLKEELSNSVRMRRRYEDALRRLPRGSLVGKQIKGHRYYYLAMRQGARVKFLYKGRLSIEARGKYQQVRRKRLQYRKLLRQVKHQIAFLQKALHGNAIRALS
ncbi:MAG: hypothetical protein HY737_01295 [Candidatus Omnitrophica bacterium]|nr:hypothetical protein [Candidatus Omnitrophota bacterium]